MENQKEIDLVIPIGAGMSWDNELRYVLRSYYRNVPNLGKVFLVGPKVYRCTGMTLYCVGWRSSCMTSRLSGGRVLVIDSWASGHGRCLCVQAA